MSTRIRLVAAVVAALLLIGAGVALAAPPSGMAGGWARGGMMDDPEQMARQHQQMYADPEMQRHMQTRHHTDGQGPHCPGGQPREQ